MDGIAYKKIKNGESYGFFIPNKKNTTTTTATIALKKIIEVFNLKAFINSPELFNYTVDRLKTEGEQFTMTEDNNYYNINNNRRSDRFDKDKFFIL